MSLLALLLALVFALPVGVFLLGVVRALDADDSATACRCAFCAVGYVAALANLLRLPI